MTTTKRVTAEELWGMGDSGRGYELVRGELRFTMPAGGAHSEIAGEIYWLLRGFLRDQPIGLAFIEVGCVLARDPDIVRGPDVAFVRAERLPPPEERIGYLPLAPDLVVEVISPNDRPGEV